MEHKSFRIVNSIISVDVLNSLQVIPLLPSVRGRPSTSRTAEQTQRSSTFPRRIRSHADRCSRLARWGRAE